MSIVITGDQEVINLLRQFAPMLNTKVILPYTKEYAEGLRKLMIPKMHRRSGRMASSTRVSAIQNGWMCIVDVSYAQEENSRGGQKIGKQGTGQGTPHRFAEPAVNEMTRTGLNRLQTLLSTFMAGL